MGLRRDCSVEELKAVSRVASLRGASQKKDEVLREACGDEKLALRSSVHVPEAWRRGKERECGARGSKGGEGLEEKPAGGYQDIGEGQRTARPMLEPNKHLDGL